MPNHIKNVVFFYGDMKEIKKMRREVSSSGREGESDYVLDFNKLIPMPPELDVVAGSASQNSLAAYCIMNNLAIPEECKVIKHFFEEEVIRRNKRRKVRKLTLQTWIQEQIKKGKREIDLDLGKRVYSNIEKFGYSNWYDWRIVNWGTKWNCYECEDEGPSRIAFLTAWSPPDPVFDKLARRYPKIEFTCYAVDEGDSETVWQKKYEKGELSEQYTFRDAELVQRIWNASGNEFIYKEEKNEH